MGKTAPSAVLTKKMKGWILLDNKFTITIFYNPDIVKDIQNMKNKLIDGIFQTT